MNQINASPQAVTDGSPEADMRPWKLCRAASLDFESFSWLAPKVPLRQVIRILGAGQDPLAEQFRLLYARLERLREMRPLKTVLVTSSLPLEGRSFVALSLAVAMSQRRRNKVLLLEADLRRPSYCSTLGISAAAGLTDYCRGGAALPDFLYRISGLDLCFLPAGRSRLQTTEVLGSRRMRQVLAETAAAFDWVVLDSAPLLPVADSVLLSHRCDGILLVVRRNQALQTALAETLDRLEPAKLLGIVLNEFPACHPCETYFKETPESISGSTERAEAA